MPRTLDPASAPCGYHCWYRWVSWAVTALCDPAALSLCPHLAYVAPATAAVVFLIALQNVKLPNAELQNAEKTKRKTSNYKTPITKGRKLQKVELQNVESYKRWKNKRSKVTKYYKKPKKVEIWGTVYRKNPLGLGLG